jgi:hypothetical protein
MMVYADICRIAGALLPAETARKRLGIPIFLGEVI